MTPQGFISKWRPVTLTERSACQQHFLDLCELLGQPKPAAADPEGAWYTFERGVHKIAGGKGWADVWMRGHFGWEYKGKHKDLAAAYEQLLRYREDLENPPLLVVCDMDRFEIHTNFTGTVKRVHAFDLEGISDPTNLDVLRKMFTEPQSLRPEQTTVGITEAAAGTFGQLVDGMRQRGIEAQEAAHFLMKVIFCLFAEDIGLLEKNLFTTVLRKCKNDPGRLSRLLQDLFQAMAEGGDFGADSIAHFNGGLFADADVIELRNQEIDQLISLGRYDWSDVEPSIFGTLFERTLDPDKRAQIGAHYTSRQDILTLVEPVLMTPLLREWGDIKHRCDALWPSIQQAAKSQKAPSRGRRQKESKPRRDHDKLIHDFVERLAHIQVLDPACGSGNFLYVAIHTLLDLEKEVIAFAADRGLSLVPQVRPTQLHGIEINAYAQQLGQVVIWIGYLQWMQHNGFSSPRDPVLEPIESIKLMDAILDTADPDNPSEPEWPETDVLIGNPPFLGGKLLRTNLGDDYIDALFDLWSDRVPREGDLCCYWFEKARRMIQRGRAKRAGLLATQGIRGGANREVLQKIKETGDIFFAVSDRDWILDGANVHVSMVGFDDGTEETRVLDGISVPVLNPDLTTGAQLADARRQSGARGIAFMGVTPAGKFEVSQTQVDEWLDAPNASGRSNGDVLRPWLNARDITSRARGKWIIDFGCEVDLEHASQYEAPFAHVKRVVAPKRASYRTGKRGYWCFERPRPEMRSALDGLVRYVATPLVSKHRLFVWLDESFLPANLIITFAREDDYFFGVLHSAVHERWSLRKGTALEDRPRYTPTTCFETFPFPPYAGGIYHDVPGTGDFNGAPGDYDVEQALTIRERITNAAVKLNELRENWLNPVHEDGSPALSEAQLKKRTLTNLYNERPTWLELVHLELDRAVLAAYGWPENWAEGLQPGRDEGGKVNPLLGITDPEVEEQVLARLLALNLAVTTL